jgi:hypothetical protein
MFALRVRADPDHAHDPELFADATRETDRRLGV